MSFYPSLEDMKVDHLAKAQVQHLRTQHDEADPSAPIVGFGTYSTIRTLPMGQQNADDAEMYPTLNDYMGLEFSDEIIAANMPEYLPVALRQTMEVGLPQSVNGNTMIAPISGASPGLQRAQVTNAVREVILCKDEDGKVGLRVKDVDKGVFVSLVAKKSPAALAGLRFGDQILQINGINVAGMKLDDVHSMFKKLDENGIRLAVRDRPFERTVTLHKDSSDHIGFTFKDGEINNIVRDSSAARNGLLINHQLLEVNGQNVVGMKDRDVGDIVREAGSVITVTIMPSYIYNHIIKRMGSSLISKMMDHSLYDY